MNETPLWVEDHPRPEGLSGPLPERSDVLIIGSGFTGLSAALRLAEANRDVTVIDAGEIASGASSRNGGMVSPDVKAGVDVVWKRHGEQIAREMWKSTVDSVELVKVLARDERINAYVVEGGMTGVTSHPDGVKRFERTVRWYGDKMGAEWEVLSARELQGYVGGTERFVAGFHEPEGIGIQPAQFAFGLAGAVVGAGAGLVEHCEAIEVRRRGAGFDVVTSLGTVRAGTVLIATNGYTSTRPIAQLGRGVVPIGSYIIVTEPLPANEAESIFPTNSMSYTAKRLLNYMRRTPDDRILIGGRRNLHTDLSLQESASDLRHQLLAIWPQLADKQVTHVWGGKLAVPFDLTPHMGTVDGVWYAMGYAGHGVGLATQLGHEFAGMVLGEDPPSVYTKIPHHGRWYYRGKPWFLTPASVLYRTLDRVGM